MMNLFTALALVSASALVPAEQVRSSKFFMVDLAKKKIVSSADRTQQAFALKLVSVSTDQPQYWPNEKVFLKVIAPGHASEKIAGTWSRRDAASHTFTLALDDSGVGVLAILEGDKAKLELGEYRVELSSGSSEKSASLGSATFAVVEGALGALSFAYEFKRVTSIAELEKAKGGWFLGNAEGAGKRWGNGLSFKNELRAANQPYEGEVVVYTRCMLPGCNGSHAGRDMTMKVVHGMMQGTLDVSSHSGPFQIEVITPRGSLRYQFEGSSHVERDMVIVSGGVGALFRAGLAPYENTEAVPGKQIFIEKSASSLTDAFTLASVVAHNGSGVLKTAVPITGTQMLVFTPGSKEAYSVEKRVLGDLAAGKELAFAVPPPYAIVAVGGFAGKRFVEGWAMVFAPAGLHAAISAPDKAGPKAAITLDLVVMDDAGKPLSVSGIVEAFDNRVASRSPEQGLSSAVGDSLRNSSQTLSSWRDNTGIDERAPKADSVDEESVMAPASAPPPSPKSSPSPSMQPMMKLQRQSVAGGALGSGSGAPSARGGEASSDDAPKELIREGERKVVLAQAVHTGADGHTKLTVNLPPQTGRVTLRFVASRGLDFSAAQRDVDASLAAYVDVEAPHVLVPGAALNLRVDAGNSTAEKLTLTAVGLANATHAVPPGGASTIVAVSGGGSLTLKLANASGKILDQRVLAIDNLGSQSVTFTRLELGGAQTITLAKDETAVVYRNSGELLHGVAMNMVTTMESWFGHAEAISARAAADAVLIAAFDKKLLDDDGLSNTVRTGFDKSIRDLDETFVDHQLHLVRPYPGIPANLRFSGWVSENLGVAIRALTFVAPNDPRVSAALTKSRQLKKEIDGELAKHRDEVAGWSTDEWMIPVEIDGKIVYRVPTDDAVTRWAAAKLVPMLDADRGTAIDTAKLYDVFRFLRAFERVGVMQYLTEVASGLWRKGDQKSFSVLYRKIARGMIFAQDPGMIQGPAMLGGVYSTPMAMVRFLELQLLMSSQSAPAPALPTLNGKVIAYGERVTGGQLTAPEDAVVRIDRAGMVTLAPTEHAAAIASVSQTQAHIAEELTLEITLDAAHDPLEYYALVAVPSTTAIKQTEDILADYRGTLLYGQQAMGATKMQVISVPFRGSRTMRLWLEGAYSGHSPGIVMVRHIENPRDVSGVAIPTVTVP